MVAGKELCAFALVFFAIPGLTAQERTPRVLRKHDAGISPAFERPEEVYDAARYALIGGCAGDEPLTAADAEVAAGRARLLAGRPPRAGEPGLLLRAGPELIAGAAVLAILAAAALFLRQRAQRAGAR